MDILENFPDCGTLNIPGIFQRFYTKSCCKFDKQTPNLCPYQFYLYSTQASYTHRKIFIKPPKLVEESRSIARFDHNRRGYQCGTRPDQRTSKYAPERSTDGTYIPHGHFFIFIIFLLSIQDYLCLTSYGYNLDLNILG